MAAKKQKAPAKKRKPGTKRRRGVKLEPTTLSAPELVVLSPGEDLGDLTKAVIEDGGAVIGAYREPLGGSPLLFVSLPLERVAPTPFQRDLSDAHVRKLTVAMDKTRRFLDPIIVVREDSGQYLTPNGNHRLTALRELGSNAVVALLVPERKVAYQILALNIEKAHNLRERAIEVRRMYEDLATWAPQKESEFELEFEEPILVTLGFAYEQRGRLSGAAYAPAVKKVDGWLEAPLAEAIVERRRRADLLLGLDDAVNDAVKRLKERGLTSPYLKAFVVARINPLRFIKGDLPSFDQLVATMTQRASGLKVDKIRPDDLARSGGPAEE